MSVPTGVLSNMSDAHRERLLELASVTLIPAGVRLFEEGSRADRFWVIRRGGVALDVHVPGRRAPVVETLGEGDLVGWSWLAPPRRWHLGAQTLTEVEAFEFDAEAVTGLCRDEPALGLELVTAVATVIGHRLAASRRRLLDLYGPAGSGPLL
ncbi:cyclic nucleotide-binding domain-containing protein [Streptomyces sp. bgisy100]|uniref:cyclic nucleotide-binding domain-containing protein n=1 Tax=Streptomyces sp. bgisy100 TaxID=3413783 RepID=UPI003D74FCDA